MHRAPFLGGNFPPVTGLLGRDEVIDQHCPLHRAVPQDREQLAIGCPFDPIIDVEFMEYRLRTIGAVSPVRPDELSPPFFRFIPIPLVHSIHHPVLWGKFPPGYEFTT